VTRRATATRGKDPYGLGPARGYVGPIAAAVALLLVAVVTLNLMNGQLPFSGGSRGNGGPAGPVRTPAPSNVVIPEPEATFPGSIVYAKAGNIWIQTADDVRQLTDSGRDSMPSFSFDGEWVFFIRETTGKALWPVDGRRTWYDLLTPEVVRVPADGSAPPEQVVSGRMRANNSQWFAWMRQPVVSPDGNRIALTTDVTAPSEGVALHFLDLETKAFTRLELSQSSGLGHQDPAWEPLGRYVAFVKNGREGSRGAPQILKYNPENGRSFTITGPGYLSPAWSPDTKYFAATRTDTFGTDVVILDGATGAELLRVTDDDASFSPIWSPAGDALAFLHLEGTIVDLKMAKLDGAAGRWTLGETISLTNVSGLDAASRPGWFVPASELPQPSPTPPGVSPSGTAAPTSP
jgi:dipeptidyl aminopeptidase/acylaminoacyl peptidase